MIRFIIMRIRDAPSPWFGRSGLVLCALDPSAHVVLQHASQPGLPARACLRRGDSNHPDSPRMQTVWPIRFGHSFD